MATPTVRHVFVTGATGYLGGALVPALLARGHRVRALSRAGSEGRLPAACEVVTGDALDSAAWASRVAPCDTLVHLVGVPHASPSKAHYFRTIDQRSVEASLAAARAADVRHFVYLSVAQPGPIMKEYQAVRAECEAALRASGLRATFVRPWYVLGPGHRWPLVLVPLYALASLLPPTREGARRLGLVTLAQMTAALVEAVEHEPADVRIVEVPAIRAAARNLNAAEA